MGIGQSFENTHLSPIRPPVAMYFWVVIFLLPRFISASVVECTGVAGWTTFSGAAVVSARWLGGSWRIGGTAVISSTGAIWGLGLPSIRALERLDERPEGPGRGRELPGALICLSGGVEGLKCSPASLGSGPAFCASGCG